MTARWTWAAALAVALLAAPVAADVIVAGRVVKTDRREVYVNLGEGVGVEVGGRIRFKRPIALRHPVTRAAVNDWLPLGDGEVTAVGDQLARIELAPELLTAIKAGDLAEIYVERAEAAPPPPPPPPKPSPDDRPIPTVDPETAQVLQVWRATTGKAIDERIGAWSGWLASHAASPYAEAVRADLEVLRATAEAMTPDRPGGRRALDLHVEHAAPKRALAGGDVPLAFVLADPEQVVAASLHVRTRGQTVFERVELVREHGVYLRGALPAALVAAPGVEYFVEAIGADGSAGAAYASDVAPATIEVDAPAPGRAVHAHQAAHAADDHRQLPRLRDVRRSQGQRRQHARSPRSVSPRPRSTCCTASPAWSTACASGSAPTAAAAASPRRSGPRPSRRR
ncbi:MAG: hypothetical protein IPH44_23995 [Myxococcales bacterium]|nr:hypothetical protein [Myxococcales bacterium]